MAGAVKVDIDVRGLSELRAVLPGKPRIVVRALRKSWRKLASQARTILRQQTPRGKGYPGAGNLRRSLRTASTAFSAQVLWKPTARDGTFRYAWALNASDKWGHRGYLDRAKAQVESGPLGDAVDEIGREIEALWQAR